MGGTPMRIHELVDKATRLRSEDKTFSYNELSGDDLELQELAELWVTATEWATAARAVKDAIGEELVRVLGDSSRNVTASGQLIWLGVSTKEECVDPEGFNAWLYDNPAEIERVFNPNTARKGSLPPAVRDSFFEKVQYGEPKMQSVPVEVLAQKKR